MKKFLPHIDFRRSIQMLLGLFSAAVLLISMRAWRTPADFPTSPVFDFLPQIPRPLDMVLPVCFLLLSLALIFARKTKRIHFALVIIGLLLTLLDINRLHPWFYLILWVNLTLLVVPAGNPGMLRVLLALLIFGIYFWSGFHKLNPQFPKSVLPWLLEPWGLFQEGAPSGIGYLLAVLEMAMPVLMLFHRTRWVGFSLLCGMHLMILIAIGPFGHNWNQVVWPWNIAMPVFAWLTFVKADRPPFELPDVLRIQVFSGLMAIFVVFLPGLHSLGKWNGYLSWSLYSGRIPTAGILLEKEFVPAMPPFIQNRFLESGPDYRSILLTEWSERKRGVAPFPSPSNFRSMWAKMKQQMPVLAGHAKLVIIYSEGTHTRNDTLP